MRSRDGTSGSKSGGKSGPPRPLNDGSGGVLDRLIKCDFQIIKNVVILTPSSKEGSEKCESQLPKVIAYTQCPGGGIGRRAWFRSMCRKVWRFESSSGHHR